jgi:hypothetical protein
VFQIAAIWVDMPDELASVADVPYVDAQAALVYGAVRVLQD